MNATISHPDAETRRMQAAFALAQEVSKAAARAIIEIVMNGEEPGASRYLLSMEWDANTRTFARANACLIDVEALLVSLPHLAEMIDDSGDGLMPSTSELVSLAKACVRRVKFRLVK
jgi:hypothetical protein